jgi:dTDP-4-dehydrorhamnose reductase
MKKILVFGANGMTGWEIAQRARSRPLDVVALDRTQVDITDSRAVEDAVTRVRPDIVFNAAAYTAVDKAEDEPELALAVNADGAGHVARAAAATGACVVQISTDYVFDGKSELPYGTRNPTNPINVYGQSKLFGEDAVRQANPRHAIVRTSWVFSHRGRNFVRTMVDRASSGSLRVVNDQIGQPTCATDLAAALITVGMTLERDSDLNGVWHFANSGVTSWYDFARAIFEMKGSSPVIEPVPTSEFPTKARRPAYSALDTIGFEMTFGVRPRHWREALRETLERIN